MVYNRRHSRSRVGIGILISLIALFLLAACGTDTAPQNLAAPSAFDGKLPNTTLADWLSYGEQISIVTITSEAQKEPNEGVRERGEGYVPRSVTATIDRTLWVQDGIEERTGEIEWTDLGWAMHDGKLTPFAGQHKVGQRYLVPLTQFDRGFGPMLVVPIPLEGDRVASELAIDYTFGDVNGLAGATIETVEARVAAAEPYPEAGSFMDLDPVARYEAVRAAQAEHVTPDAPPHRPTTIAQPPPGY